MNTSFGVIYPLWIAAAGRPDFLDRLVGEIGVDHLTVPVIGPPERVFQAALATGSTPWFATEGGWHYPPAREHYTALSDAPHRARWQKQRDALAALCKTAAAQQLRVIARVSLRHVPALREQLPAAVWRDAWGEPLPEPGLCVLAPEVREVLAGVVRDLTRYELAGIELADWDLDVPSGMPHGIGLPPAAREMAGTCFAPAARQVAGRQGLDVDATAAAVREYVAAVAAQPDAAPPPVPELVAAYRQVLVDDHLNWLEPFAGQVPFARRLLHGPAGDSTAVGGWEALQPANAAEPAAGRAGSAGPTGLCFRVGEPPFTAAPALVRAVTSARERQVMFFDFENLAAAPDDALTWVKQAIRFARRQ